MALEENLTTEEQQQFDQMRADDVPVVVEPVAPTAEDAGSVTEAQEAPNAPADKRPQMVPHAALHEERERRKAVEVQIAEERKARQTLEERTNLLLQRIGLGADGQPQPAAPALPEIPNIETDPVGHLLGQMARQQKVIEGMAGALQQRGQLDQQVAAAQTTQQRAMLAERDFRQQTEDYDAAVNHLMTQRHKVLEMAGYTDPVQRHQLLAREAMDVVNRAFQMNRNPAEMIYELAEVHGYQKKAPEPADDKEPDAAPRAPIAERIAQQARGQQQDGRTLSGVRGTGPRPLTAQRLIEMPDAEFAKIMETPEGRELMGH